MAARLRRDPIMPRFDGSASAVHRAADGSQCQRLQNAASHCCLPLIPLLGSLPKVLGCHCPSTDVAAPRDSASRTLVPNNPCAAPRTQQSDPDIPAAASE